MTLEAFLRERGPAWESLERELGRGRRARRDAPTILALGREYRAVVADLALARRRFPGDPVVARLERLVLAARTVIYRDEARERGALRRFASRGYWRLVIGRPGILAAAAAALVGPAILAAVWGAHDPAAAIGLVPERFHAAADPHVRHLPLGAATQAVLASSIFTNNISVAFLAFAGGLTLGLGTLIVLAYNGILLGALVGITLQAGSFPVLVRYVVPHGLLELSCFTVAGAAGLRLAWSVIEPGALPRGISLRAQARPAVALVLGTAPWLVVAGLTEGFVTPHGLPLGAAVAVGTGLAGGFWTLTVLRGRTPSEQRPGLAPHPLTAPPVT